MACFKKDEVVRGVMAGFLATLLTGCITLDNHETLYGITTVSKPFNIPAKDLEEAFNVTVQNLSFEQALAEAAKPQSAAYRRRQVKQQAGLRASADLMKLQQLKAGADKAKAAGIQYKPDASLLSGPGLPDQPTLLAADEGFISGALGETPSLSIPYSRRIQTAMNNVMMTRVASAMPEVYKKLEEDWELHYAFNNLTVNPGLLTNKNSYAEVKVQWEFPARLSEKEFHVIPLFPTFEAVAQYDDAASMDEFTLFLTMLAQYGPAQAQGQYQRMTNDVKRLVSMSHRVTMLGSSVADNTFLFRVTGTRSASPLSEKRPTGRIMMEPLTLPMVSLIMVKKDKAAEGVDISMAYSGRWKRERWLWDKLPLPGMIPGLFYTETTPFYDPEKIDCISKISCLKGIIQFLRTFEPSTISDSFTKSTRPAEKYSDIITIKSSAKNNPVCIELKGLYCDYEKLDKKGKPTVQSRDIIINSPYPQVFAVTLTTGTAPNEFLLDNISIKFEKVSSKVYKLILEQSTLDYLQEAHNISTSNTVTVKLVAVNKAGVSKGLPVNLAYKAREIEFEQVLTLTGDNGTSSTYRTLKKGAGEIWNPEELKVLDDKDNLDPIRLDIKHL